MPPSPSPFSFDPDASDSAWMQTELDAEIRFPPLPRTVAEVTYLVSDDDAEPDPRKLADLVDSDPVIAAAVLQRINSAYYGMRRRITSARKAVMLLGFLDVANVVLTAGMLQLEDVFAGEEHVALFERIMHTSVGVGQFAREIADALSLPEEGPAYSAGLLHGIGRLIFLYSAPDAYAALWHDAPSLPAIDAEADAFGTTHPEVGAHAADAWRLPDALVQAIQHYTLPERAEGDAARTVAALVCVAVDAQRAATLPDVPADAINAAALAFLARTADTTPSAIEEVIAERSPRVQDYVSMIMSS